jgi:hypothetical protein
MTPIKWIKTIGLYQVFGGVLGLLLMAPDLRFCDTVTTSLSFVLILFFLFSVFAGIKLYKLKPGGRTASIWSQALQIFTVAAGNFYYSFISGISFQLTLDLTDDIKIGFESATSRLSIILQGTEDHFYFGINLVPILIIMFLDKFKTDIEERRSHEPGHA